MNEQIRISPIRLIGAEGEAHGIVPTSQALEMAREAGLDLVEVSATERPPVCKIMDFGKFKYAQSKKAHQKTHQQKLKEIRVRPKTGEHDVETKIVQARKFLEHNDKVQVNVLFRGREMQHIEEGQRVMNQVLEALQNDCKVESPARMEGKRMVALLAPKPTGGKPGAPKPKTDAKPKPKPETEAKSEGKPEVKPEAKAEAKPAPAASADGEAAPAKPAAVSPAPKPAAAAPAAKPAATPAAKPASSPAPNA
jgi:translation initiation factor IF-3